MKQQIFLLMCFPKLKCEKEESLSLNHCVVLYSQLYLKFTSIWLKCGTVFSKTQKENNFKIGLFSLLKFVKLYVLHLFLAKVVFMHERKILPVLRYSTTHFPSTKRKICIFIRRNERTSLKTSRNINNNNNFSSERNANFSPFSQRRDKF